MVEAITSNLTVVIGWIGTVLDAVVGAEGQLAELKGLFALGIVVSVILLGVKVLRSFTWGG